VTEALVIPPKSPPQKGESDSFELILPWDIRGPTHSVRNPNDGEDYDVRVMIQVQVPVNDKEYFDPFDFRFSTSSVLASMLLLFLFSFQLILTTQPLVLLVILDPKRGRHEVKDNGLWEDAGFSANDVHNCVRVVYRTENKIWMLISMASPGL